MFDAAESGLTLSDRAYETTLRHLRPKLLAAHFALRDSARQVVVVVSGADGAGKGELVHTFNEWLDPRAVATHAFWDDSDEETARPHFWRFWRALPGRGRVGILFGSWYTRPIIERVARTRRKRDFLPELDRIVAFERMLASDGTTLLKLWLHLSKDAQRTRLRELGKAGRLGPDDRKHFRQYERFRLVSERALLHTHEPWAPWHVIDATDRRHREVTAGKLLLAALEGTTGWGAPGAGELPAPDERTGERAGDVGRARVARTAVARTEVARDTVGRGPGTRAGGQRDSGARAAGPRPSPRRPATPILNAVDLSQRLGAAAYAREMATLQERVSRLAWRARAARVATVLAFEGWDAAGKGSAIRRVTAALDPRLYQVVGIAAPSDEERAQHYLWRFWRQLPRDGRITIFDRSWYGRVLVERVEGFCTPAEWGRAYTEIPEFERQLTDHGMAVAKFWIHLSAKEQLRRFRERERVPWKRHKITPDDWRNRAKRPAYAAAVEEMLTRCESASAPWTVVAGEDKRFARVQILRTVAERLEGALGG